MYSLFKSITKKEWLLVFLVALLVIMLTAAPFLYGYFTRPADSVFTGLHHLAPGDTNVFLSMIEQVKQGNNVFLNLYTSEPQSRILTNPLWLSVGWLAKIFNMPNLLALQVARSIWIVIFIFVLYLFLAYLFRDVNKRKWVLFLVLFSSGLGVFFNPFLFDVNNIYEHPTDIWVTESITFLTLLHSPHVIASLTLIILIFLLMLLAFDTDKLRFSIGAGMAAFFLLWFHPFNGPTIYVTLGVYLLVIFIRQRKVSWRYIRHYLILSIIPLPIVVYLYLLSQLDWVIRNWAAQNILSSPSVWMYLIGYGFIFVLASLGLWVSIKRFDSKKTFIVIWAMVTSILIYMPVSFQRRMSEGWHIPLSILAFLGILFLFDRLGNNKTKKLVLVMALLIFLPLTNIQIIGQDFYLFQSKKSLPYYLHEEEVAAMHWLRDNSGIEEVVFSSFYIGNYIPAYSGRIVWIGHGPQTIDLSAKLALSSWFWEEDTEADKKYSLLIDGRVSYLYYGSKEKEAGIYNPASKSYLKEVYRNTEVAIYKVL
ncbi:hypothetical protein IID19_01980 [Patescibacteria group bacterium]|nr:hypothetical protein [Patescibacteria group bacterium]